MSVQISIDSSSLAHLQNQMRLLQAHGNRSLYNSLVKLAFKIKTEAQERLKGQRHVVTSRLRNSIYVQANDPNKVNTPNNKPNYQDKNSNTFNSQLQSVGLTDTELAVGTNVEYAPLIESYDSYLYWAMRNVNVEQSVAQDMRDFMKFGTGVIPTQQSTRPTP
jgi:hypothetical protein